MNPTQPLPPDSAPNQQALAEPTQPLPAYPPDTHQVVAQIPGAVVELPQDGVVAQPIQAMPNAAAMPMQPQSFQPPPTQPPVATMQSSMSQPAMQPQPQPGYLPGQPPIQYQQPQPMQPQPAFNQFAGGGFDATAQSSMRSKILKIIAGLTLFSILGVGGIFMLTNSADPALTDVTQESNTLATYDIPASWTIESDARYLDYFNGDTRRGSSAMISVLKPQRLKFSGSPLTPTEIDQIIEEISDLEARNVSSEITVIEETQIEVEGFDRSYEFFYESQPEDGGDKVVGKFRVFFDNKANLHTLEVAAVKQYWNTNQEQLDAILDSYRLVN